MNKQKAKREDIKESESQKVGEASTESALLLGETPAMVDAREDDDWASYESETVKVHGITKAKAKSYIEDLKAREQ